MLSALQDGRQISQAELARLTGLAPATVSGLVRDLADEGELEVGEGVANGRRSRMVRRSPQRLRYGIGLYLGRAHVEAVAGTEAGDLLAESSAELAPGYTPDAAIAAIAALAATVRERAGLTADQVTGVAVAVPAPVDVRTGTLTEAVVLPALDGVALRERLGPALDRPVVVENDANLGALALTRRAGAGAGPLVYVKVATGIGAGVAVDGRLVRGAAGSAGEIGHLPLDPGLTTVCRCGRRGCLETVGSAAAVGTALAAALGREVGPAGLHDLIAEGHPVAARVLEDAGEALGRGLGWLSMVVDPAEIVLGGPLTSAGEAWLRPVVRGFRRAVLPGAARRTRISLSPLGERTESVGALIASLTENSHIAVEMRTDKQDVNA
nr:ROK family transcriptional regulator [Jiangella mangrovi]